MMLLLTYVLAFLVAILLLLYIMNIIGVLSGTKSSY
jgi:hypothetical protein